MAYRNLRQCVDDLEATGQLIRVETEIDPHLEVAEIHRRVFRAGGPAILFTRVKGCDFPMVSNLFGTIERARFLFRDSLEAVRQLIEAKIDPPSMLFNPRRWLSAVHTAYTMLPQSVSGGPILDHETTVYHNCKVGPKTVGRLSPCRWSTQKIPLGPAGKTRTLECTASNSLAANITKAKKSASTIRFIVASASITPPPCAVANRWESTFLSVVPRR